MAYGIWIDWSSLTCVCHFVSSSSWFSCLENRIQKSILVPNTGTGGHEFLLVDEEFFKQWKSAVEWKSLSTMAVSSTHVSSSSIISLLSLWFVVFLLLVLDDRKNLSRNDETMLEREALVLPLSRLLFGASDCDCWPLTACHIQSTHRWPGFALFKVSTRGRM